MRERRSDGLYNTHTHIQYVEGHEICSKNEIVQTKVQQNERNKTKKKSYSAAEDTNRLPQI